MEIHHFDFQDAVIKSYKEKDDNVIFERTPLETLAKDIKLEFKNNSANTVNLNGIQTTIYTPFVTTVATILDSNCKNIEITNGKVVSNAKSNILVSIAAPGLYESTNMGMFKDMDKVTISYDTKKFKLDNIYITSTPKLLDSTDLDVFNRLDSITNSMTTLKNGMDSIKNGSLELKTKLGESLKVLDQDALSQDQVEEIKNETVNSITEKEEEINTKVNRITLSTQ